MKNYFSITVAMMLLASCASKNNSAEGNPATVLISDTSKQARCVYLAMDEKDQPVISWCETDKQSSRKDFYLAYFDTAQRNFGNRIRIPIEQEASLHEEGMPKIAIKGDGTIIAVYETAVKSAKNMFAGFVRYVVSSDKGSTWSAPAFLHSDTSSDNSHSFAAITRLSNGEVGACWLDQTIDQKMVGRPVTFAKTDNANQFSNELIIDSVACQCCRIALSSGGNGRISVAFRDILNDSIRDMSVCNSIDNGNSFSAAVPFSNDGWVINGCPHNGPSLAVSENNTYAVWFTGANSKGIYYGELDEHMKVTKKQLVSDRGRFIQLCLLANKTPLMAYNETVREGDNMYSKIVLNRIVDDKVFTSDIISGKSKASYPVLRPLGDISVVVAWSEQNRIYYAVRNAESINKPLQRLSATIADQELDYSKIKLAMSHDPVCGMPLSMSPGDTAVFAKMVYGFCSPLCKGRFLKDPSSFVAK